MINEVKINNFKSVQDATLSLGRFNVLIGSNGSGKSNILEAIAFGAAASADKLDNEFLESRGIRIADYRLMKNAFTQDTFSQPIELKFNINDEDRISFTIEEKESPISKWFVNEREEILTNASEFYNSFLSGDVEKTKIFETLSNEEKENIKNMSTGVKTLLQNEPTEEIINLLKISLGGDFYKELTKKTLYNSELSDFLIYSPEVTALRKFETESTIKPLGIKGEGIFDALEIFKLIYLNETFEEIKHFLRYIEWFDDFESVYDQVTGRKGLVVKDKFIPNITLNQTNVNEGFLFLLFYISLIISKETPAFFAIDNIEASFHPTLCQEMIKDMVALSKKYNKQLIITTHSPFVLDGLDLSDPEQKLFVVRRSSEGDTFADPITKAPQNVKLSEAWARGYIGGQPETIL